MRARPTIKDIAAEVGVSHTTVSYILSGNTTQKISPDTRILTSRSNFVRGGKECTALLLHQLRGERCEGSVVLPPDIPSYIDF